MKSTKVTLLLLTCGTNACYHIAKHLKELYKSRIRIVGTDINKPWMIATQPYLDAFYQCPKTGSDNYKDFILEICDKEKVNYLMPSFDADQMLFYQGVSELKQREIVSLGIPQAVSVIYRSKEEMNQFLENHQLPVPRFYQVNEVEDDNTYFCKPKNGVGSVGIKKLTGKEIKRADTDGLIIEEVCSEPEVTLECFNYKGKVYSVARERLDAKAGVCTKARVYWDEELQTIAQRFAETIELPYVFNLQFMNNKAGQKVITDVNLRTAGGMSLSCAAGWDEAAALGKILLGEQDIAATLEAPKRNVYVVRAYTDIVTKACNRRIAFDLDGTLLDSRKRHKIVMDDVLRESGILLDTTNLISYKADGHNNLEWLKKNGIAARVAENINKRWITLIEDECYLREDNLYEGVEKLLSELSKTNTLYLITARNNKKSAEQQITQLGIRKYFDDVYVVASSKQTSDDKAAILKHNSIDIFIGDTESDFKSAQLANCSFIATTFGFRAAKYWANYKVRTIDKINDIEI